MQGRGLFSGEPCKLTIKPAEPNAGLVFVRTDLAESLPVGAHAEQLAKRARRTSLMDGQASIETVEHVLSAIWGLGIDNATIEVTAAETPSIDGSADPFAKALQEAGIEEQDAERDPYIITDPVSVSEGNAMLAALPGPSDSLDILYELDYQDISAGVGKQVCSFRLGRDDYLGQIAPARTFVLESEANDLRAKGIGEHLSAKDLVVMTDDGPLDNELRFEDENARHKICDLIGDLALVGRRLCGRIVACRSGHELNHALARKLLEAIEDQQQADRLSGEPVMDIRKIMRLLPHRYPFLMVDRLIELDGDRKAVGVKNVTINEPFFQGHYPSQPIMPGVLVLEALAQLSGILLSRRLEHTGKVAFLIAMDRVKIRRPVRPGDQVLLHAEALHVRSRTGHTRCWATVGKETSAEAEIKFMLVDAEPI